MSKPLIKWNIGPVSEQGFLALKKSVNSMKKLYKECDFVVCHNQLDESQLKFIKSINVDLFDQNHLAPKSVDMGFNTHWKLWPARLSENIHEICIDNDIIINERIEEIDLFLKEDKAILMCQGISANYGKYFENIKPQCNFFNSSIFGLYPGYPFEKKIKTYTKQNTKWSTNKFDEQGLIVSVLSQHNRRYVIPLTTIGILETEFELNELVKNKNLKGIHFVGLNQEDKHRGFYNYFNKIKL